MGLSRPRRSGGSAGTLARTEYGSLVLWARVCTRVAVLPCRWAIGRLRRKSPTFDQQPQFMSQKFASSATTPPSCGGDPPGTGRARGAHAVQTPPPTLGDGVGADVQLSGQAVHFLGRPCGQSDGLHGPRTTPSATSAFNANTKQCHWIWMDKRAPFLGVPDCAGTRSKARLSGGGGGADCMALGTLDAQTQRPQLSSHAQRGTDPYGGTVAK